MFIKRTPSHLLVTIESDQTISECLDKVIREYQIIDGLVTGYGDARMMHVAAVAQIEPLFYNKSIIEGNLTVNVMHGSITNRKWDIHTQFCNDNFEQFSGHIIDGLAWHTLNIQIRVFKTQ